MADIDYENPDFSFIPLQYALANVRKHDTEIILNAINKMNELIKVKLPNQRQLSKVLNTLKEECDKGLPHKMLASQCGAYFAIVSALEAFSTYETVTVPGFEAIISLMTGQPHLLDRRGIALMMRCLDAKSGDDTYRQVLKWIKECCWKRAKNRQDILNMGILNRLKRFLDVGYKQELLLRDACAVMRALVMDDDSKGESSSAHEHARVLASEMLCTVTRLLKKYEAEKEVVGDLILTLTALVGRSEFCEKVEQSGGITLLIDVLNNYPKSEKIGRLSLRLLKSLSGNGKVQKKIIEAGGAPVIVQTMEKHMDSPSLVAIGCLCVSALTLKNVKNSQALIDAGAAECITSGMCRHPGDINVQKSGCWAIRNIASRSSEYTKIFQNLRADKTIRDALKKHGKNLEFDAKTALRDLCRRVK